MHHALATVASALLAAQLTRPEPLATWSGIISCLIGPQTGRLRIRHFHFAKKSNCRSKLERRSRMLPTAFQRYLLQTKGGDARGSTPDPSIGRRTSRGRLKAVEGSKPDHRPSSLPTVPGVYSSKRQQLRARSRTGCFRASAIRFCTGGPGRELWYLWSWSLAAKLSLLSESQMSI